jgi:hypothetical protein
MKNVRILQIYPGQRCLFADFFVFLGVLLLTSVSVSASAASGPEVDSVGVPSLAAGAEVVVRGTNFGQRKGDVNPVLFDFGHQAYENGVLNTFNANLSSGDKIDRDSHPVWVKPSVSNSTGAEAPVLERTGSRVQSADAAHYRMEGINSFLGWPAAYGGFDTPTDNPQLYVSWYIKTKHDARWYWSTTPLNQKGIFIEGEAVKIGGVNGYYIGTSGKSISEGMLQFILPGEKNANNIRGQEIFGLQSGASTTFHPDFAGGSGVGYLGPGSNKYLRVWEDPTGSEGFGLAWTNAQIVQSSLTPEDVWKYADLGSSGWHQMELFIDTSSGEIKAKVDGKVLLDSYFGDDQDLVGKWSPTVALLGFNGKIQVFQETLVDDIYIDSNRSRVFLSEASRYADVGQVELQRLVDWNDSQLVFALNPGDLNINRQFYLYVVNELGEVNMNGFPMCSSCISSPKAPQNPSVR